MGQLSDAIREHLELKRQHGAAEDEVSQQEAEALGPVRREPDAVAPAAEEDRPSSSFDTETALIGSDEPHEESIELEEPEPFAFDGLEEEPTDYRDEPLDDDVASVFPEPDPAVPDERMSAEEPPPIGPRPLVDEAPVVHGEPLPDEEDELRLTGPPSDREPDVDPLEEPDDPVEPAGLDGPAEPAERRPGEEEPVVGEHAEEAVLFPAEPIETTHAFTAEPTEEPQTTDGFTAEPTEEPELLSDEATETPAEPLAFGPDPEPVGLTEPDPFATQPHAVPELEDEPVEDGRPALLDEDELEVFEETRDEPPVGEDPIEDDADFRPEEEPPRSSPAPPPRDSGDFDFDA